MSRPVVLCVVGPPASGKSVLVTALTEALRQRGRRVASAVWRDSSTAVVVLSNGARVTASRGADAVELGRFVASLEPDLDLVLIEGLSAPGLAVIELAVPGGPPPVTPDRDLLAVVISTQLLAGFAKTGPDETGGLADLIEERLLAAEIQEPPTVRRRGFLDRLRGARRGRQFD